MKRLLIALAVLTATLSARADLPFIEDDYAKAIARAKVKDVPVFVETWAPW